MKILLSIALFTIMRNSLFEMCHNCETQAIENYQTQVSMVSDCPQKQHSLTV